MLTTSSRLALFVLMACFVLPAHAVVIDLVKVGSPGNPADETGNGAVDYEFYIGKTEITKKQYAEFLNAVAASDPYRLFSVTQIGNQSSGIARHGSPGNYVYSVAPPVAGQGIGGTDYVYDDKPVVLVSLFSAFRFANWLHNGQGDGDTENGAYRLLGGTPTPLNWMTITRSPDAKWWIPNDDEWHKAAYYDPITGEYYDYPTGSNAVPERSLPASDTGNSANISGAVGNPSYPLTDVGAYTLSASPFGTFDQGGNVAEWTDTLIQQTVVVSYPRGGWWGLSGASTRAATGAPAHFENPDRRAGDVTIGFRVATSVPEPGSLTLLVVAASSVLLLRRSGR